MNITTMFLPAGIVMVMFIILWTIKYPVELWESITFRNNDGLRGYAVSLAVIVFTGGSIATLVWLCNLLAE